jgi:hypothetical protein
VLRLACAAKRDAIAPGIAEEYGARDPRAVRADAADWRRPERWRVTAHDQARCRASRRRGAASDPRGNAASLAKYWSARSRPIAAAGFRLRASFPPA